MSNRTWPADLVVYALAVWLIGSLAAAGGCASEQISGESKPPSGITDLRVYEVTFDDWDDVPNGLALNIPIRPKVGQYWIVHRETVGDWCVHLTAWCWGDPETLGGKKHIRVNLDHESCQEWYIDDEVATCDFLSVVFVSESGENMDAMKQLLESGKCIEVIRDPRCDL